MKIKYKNFDDIDEIRMLSMVRKIGVSVAKAYHIHDIEECVSAASLGLSKALLIYDKTKTLEKNKYYFLYKKGYFYTIDELRSTGVIKRIRSEISKKINTKFYSNHESWDMFEYSNINKPQDFEIQDFMLFVISSLTGTYYKIMYDIFILEKQQMIIAKEMNMTKGAITWYKQNACKILKKELESISL